MADLDAVPNRDAGAARARGGLHATGARESVSPVVICGVTRFAEFLIVALTGINAFYVYVAGRETAMTPSYWVVSIGAAFAAVAVFDMAGLYSVRALRTYVAQSARLIASWTGVVAMLMALGFFTKIGADFSRVWLTLWYVSGTAALIGVRVSASATLRMWTRQGRLARRGVIVGGGERAGELIEALCASRDSDVEICGVFDDRSDDRSPPEVAGCRKLGRLDALVEYARTARIDLLIVALPLAAEQRILDIVRRLRELPVDIRLSAHNSRLRFRPRVYSYIGAVPVLDVLDRPICDWGLVTKRIEDIVIASLALIAAVPLMALIAAAIRLDSPGPVLFRQRRHGFNNELIDVLKFRSMYADATDRDARRLVSRDDPRVTRVGRFIRRTSLDELPQLINVLRGELSLVGPRPHALQAKAAARLYSEVVDGYFARHRVKPGITGWAQINGWRGETENEMQIRRRVEHDLYYIENWSVMFDLYILVMTPFALLHSDRAY